MVLIKRYPEEKLDHIDLKQTCWAQSLFRRMGLELQEKFSFLTLSKKSSKNPICIASSKKIGDNGIPPSLVLNLDQTRSKYIPVLNKTMAPKGSITVPIKGSAEKRMITATFTITLDGHFLPVQLIYGGKTSKSLPRINFPKLFSISANSFSNSLTLREDQMVL